jgi:hypothetical protein
MQTRAWANIDRRLCVHSDALALLLPGQVHKLGRRAILGPWNVDAS